MVNLVEGGIPRVQNARLQARRPLHIEFFFTRLLRKTWSGACDEIVQLPHMAIAKIFQIDTENLSCGIASFGA